MTIHAHAFASDEKLKALRAAVAAARKARLVNLGILVRQHRVVLEEAARRCDVSARGAVGRLIDAVDQETAWSPTTTRDLRAAVRGLGAAAVRAATPTQGDRLAWLRDRAAEVLAQDMQTAALETSLAACLPSAARRITACGGGRRR